MTAYPAGRFRHRFFFCRRVPAVAMLLSLALPAQAHAAYAEKLAPDAGIVAGQEAAGRAGFIHDGPAYASAVGSRGADVPFRFAVRLIVPEKWKVSMTGRFRNSRRVSWQAQESWGSVLDRACRLAGARAEADLNARLIAITGLDVRGSEPALKPLGADLAAVTRPLSVTACAALLGMDPEAFRKLNGLAPDTVLKKGWAVRTGGHTLPEAAEEAEPRAEAAPEETPDNAKEPPAESDPVEAEVPVFLIAPGALAPQLAGWCRDAGWQLVWRASRDVSIVSSVSYKGPFASALRAVFRDLRAVGQPFRVTVFEGNRVVDVAEE